MKTLLASVLKLLTAHLIVFLTRAGEDILVGGQAVFEGVMMRSPKSYSIAVRKSDGSIVVKKDRVERPVDRNRVWGIPVIRGFATLGQAFTLGLKALKFSTDQAMATGAAETVGVGSESGEKEPELSPWIMGLNIALAIIFFVLLFKFLPLLVASGLAAYFPAAKDRLFFSLVDGVVRLLVFLLYLGGVSLIRDIRRVFEYHGAEHKVVFTYEAQEALSVDNARKYPRLHPRCGTSFLMVVILLSVLVYAFIPFDSFSLKLLSRIALIPLIAGLSYEIIRFAAKGRIRLLDWITTPGLWLQCITTREPSDEQLEIAIRALDEALVMENAEGQLAVI
jgi:uncharacterized protein YqhQ